MKRNFFSIFTLLLIPSFVLRAGSFINPYTKIDIILPGINTRNFFNFERDFKMLEAGDIVILLIIFCVISIALYHGLVHLFSNLKDISQRVCKVTSSIIALLITTAGAHIASSSFIMYSRLSTDTQSDYSPAIFMYPQFIESIFFSVILSIILAGVITFLWSKFKKNK